MLPVEAEPGSFAEKSPTQRSEVCDATGEGRCPAELGRMCVRVQAESQPRDPSNPETWDLIVYLDACRRADRAMDFVHSDPCSKIVGTRVVHHKYGP